PEDLARQGEEIDEVNSRLNDFRVLKGIEADILQDGSVDYDQRVLERLDFVIASIHSRFNMGEKEMTARMLAAMDNQYLTIIGHPTGRLLLTRDPYPIDLEAILEKAAATGVALEINGDPHRLDLDWRVLRQARDGGVAISIGADAHSIAGLSYVDYGIGMARKGWLRAEDILNARPVSEFVAHARRRR
ncbi:MAG TPA: PHP domain-containing protein, partial [Gemmatimonadales bacterium]|nr:PHP domain-containing protein [Gemmatimonadales bacterium]